MGNSPERMTQPEVYWLVNQYIGVSGGYLADFSYRSHREFYGEFCDLDIDPDDYQGTTRERFSQILRDQNAKTQATILRGILEKYPIEPSKQRTQEKVSRLQKIINRLEGAGAVPTPDLKMSSEVVRRALDEAETLIKERGATSGVDRIHTALHGYLKACCDEQLWTYKSDAGTMELFKRLLGYHPALQDMGPRTQDMKKILRSFAAVVDAMNPIRNRATMAHPSGSLLPETEAVLCINAVRTLLQYLDSKLAPPA